MAFKEIIGHEKQKHFLLSFVERGRIPHAFLFSGQEGIGKRKLAMAFAGHLLCREGRGCGTCSSCIKIARSVHPDLKILETAGSIGIDLIRGNKEKKVSGINQEVYEYPFESDRRIIIIDQADTMTMEAANALLKTLEEPPPYNVFILITSSEQGVPQTIKSRCVRVTFSPLSREELKGYYLQVLGKEKEKADLLASISYGSIRCGLFWLVKENLMLRRKLAEVLLGRKKSFVEITLISERIASSGKDIFYFLYYLLSLFRDLSYWSFSRDGTWIVNKDVSELYEEKRIDREWVSRSLRNVQETIEDMRYNVNRWLIFENMLLKITE